MLAQQEQEQDLAQAQGDLAGPDLAQAPAAVGLAAELVVGLAQAGADLAAVAGQGVADRVVVLAEPAPGAAGQAAADLVAGQAVELAVEEVAGQEPGVVAVAAPVEVVLAGTEVPLGSYRRCLRWDPSALDIPRGHRFPFCTCAHWLAYAAEDQVSKLWFPRWFL